MPALRLAGFAALTAAALAAASPADAQGGSEAGPTTSFAEGATSASVSAGDLTATVTLEKRPEIDPALAVPVLTVTDAGKAVAEAVGVASGFDYPAADATIVEIDPGNARREVYFTSYSGGAHCCTTVIVASAAPGGWNTLTIGEFDGDGGTLEDVDGDGAFEMIVADNRFLYQFDCYACSAAPLTVRTVRNGKEIDLSADPAYRTVHRDWLTQLEDNTPDSERWESAGYLAGWMATKVRLGDGPAAWDELVRRWDRSKDEAVETCLTGGEIDSCPRGERKALQFPERLRLFLDQTGYRF